MIIKPANRISGTIRLPGDKSISHRAAILAALASGVSDITNFSTSKDCASTLACLGQLGVTFERTENSIRLNGLGGVGFRAPSKPLDCGNSGSTMRLLAGVLATQDFSAILTGDSSLSNRPMQRVIDPLEMMGARLDSNDGRPPLVVKGTRALRNIRYVMPIASAQVKSAVLLAALQTDGVTEVVERFGLTRDHTERMLRYLGAALEQEETIDLEAIVRIKGPITFLGRKIKVPGDISSAAYFIAAAVLMPGSRLKVEAVGLNGTRAQFLITLRSLGFRVDAVNEVEECNEPVGTIMVNAPAQHPAALQQQKKIVAGNLIPGLIDELPLLAVIGSQVSGGIEIRNAKELRFKESNRIEATIRNLRAMGAEVEEFEDGLFVNGPTQLRGAALDSFADHRIAMAFTIAALVAQGQSEIKGSECVEISFPEFYELLDSVVERQ
jgi:3-phosphoshikimate 1-carboxyvinyltransferase